MVNAFRSEVAPITRSDPVCLNICCVCPLFHGHIHMIHDFSVSFHVEQLKGMDESICAPIYINMFIYQPLHSISANQMEFLPIAMIIPIAMMFLTHGLENVHITDSLTYCKAQKNHRFLPQRINIEHHLHQEPAAQSSGWRDCHHESFRFDPDSFLRLMMSVVTALECLAVFHTRLLMRETTIWIIRRLSDNLILMLKAE